MANKSEHMVVAAQPIWVWDWCGKDSTFRSRLWTKVEWCFVLNQGFNQESAMFKILGSSGLVPIVKRE